MNIMSSRAKAEPGKGSAEGCNFNSGSDCHWTRCLLCHAINYAGTSPVLSNSHCRFHKSLIAISV